MTANMADRDAAWQAVHDPTTDAAALAAIAQAYPEFGPAIAVHPNCYDALRDWIAATAAPPAIVIPPMRAAPAHSPAPEVIPAGFESSAAPASAPRKSHSLVIGLSAAAGLILVSGGVTWAVLAMGDRGPNDLETPLAEEASTGTPSSDSRELAGPPVYIGDELSWFLPDEPTLREHFPDIEGLGFNADLPIIGEGEGIHADIEACFPWIMVDTSPVVGSRNATWDIPSVGEYATGTYRVFQFPTGAQASEYFAEFADSVSTCSTFSVLDSMETPTDTQTLVESARSDVAVVVEQNSSSVWWGGSQTRALLLEGNVVIDIIASHAQGSPTDADRLLALVTERAAGAHEQLTEKIGYR